MATQTLNTSFVDADNRPGAANPVFYTTGFVANTGIASQYVAAPGNGKLRAIKVMGSVTSDATKTYTYVVTNTTFTGGAKVMTAASQVFDADPVLTANTAATLSLSATAADLVVDEGDIIKIDFTGGTGSGNTSVILVWDLY